MSKAILRRSCALFALTAGAIASPAWAQIGTVDNEAARTEPTAVDAPPQGDVANDPVTAEETGREIVVTGTLIRGSSEQAPVPIDVISSEELARQGSPSAIDLLKNLPTSNGIIGDANQFDARAQGNEGVASVNLRGLGPQRTLVLLNGRRVVQSGGGIPIVDVNLIPSAAIGRIEVLKDGAAATYGSDAIGGVVNFITKENQDGFLVSGDYRYIKGSKGDYGGAISYGTEVEGLRLFLSAGFQRRSELQTTDRDFVNQPYASNPQGGFTGGGNPGNYDFNSTAVGFIDPVSGRNFGNANFIRDLGCEALGGFRSLPGSTDATTGAPQDRCFNQYGLFGNLVEPEERFQVFADLEFDIGDSSTLRVSGLWGHSESQITTSPSYLPTLPPSGYAANGLTTVPAGGVLTPTQAAGPGVFVIPTYAPALRDYCAVYGAAAGCLTSATGTPLAPALAFPVLFRPTLLGGNPLYFDDNERGSATSPRISDQIWVSAEFRSALSDSLDLTTSATYSEYDRVFYGTDTFGDLLQNALAGFGGPNCAYSSAASRAGLTTTQLAALAGTNGCTFFNPFSTAVQANPVTGDVNPNFAGSRPTNGLSITPGAGLINDLATIDTFFQEPRTQAFTRQFVVDAVVSGQSGIALPGGEIGFALGAQYRKNWYSRSYNTVSNLAYNPCPGTPVAPNAICAQQTGALGFLGTNANGSSENDIKAVFAELQFPITDAIQAQLAARFEDYGGNVGSTFDPQARVKIELTDWLAVRGGVGTTFRGPPAQQLGGNVTSLQIIGSSFRAIDISGNPNLTPESATTYNAGILIDGGGFNASVDYFRYDLSGPIESEPVQGIVSALFGSTGSANCNNADYAALRARFTFTAAGCGIGNVQRLRTNIVNGGDIRTSGVDFQASYRMPFGEDSSITAGLAGTYVIEYTTSDVTVENILVQPGFDAVGLLNYQTTAYPLPEWKGNAYLQGEFGNHSLRAQVNYIDGYTDQRGAAIFGPNTGALAGAAVTAGKEIGAFTTVDVTYRVLLPTRTTVALSLQNILDEDPPFARLDQNYDPFTASPLGFNAKISVSQAF